MAKHNGNAPLLDNPVTRLVKDSASHALSVGRGAYTRAESGGNRLVGGFLGVGGRIDREAKSRVFEARNSANEAWERLALAVAHRIARTLNSMQIPTARDVHELSERVASLQAAVVALERRAAEASAAAGSRAPKAPKASAGPRRKATARRAGKRTAKSATVKKAGA
jgi:polyhydroxyalkanoate synthesis regulator phasin